MSDVNDRAERDRDETDGLAAEYVLGTLSAAERALAEAHLRSNPAFRAAVAGWERRLQPLADAAAPVAPHPDLFHRISARIGNEGAPMSVGADALPPPDSNVVVLQQAVSRWRVATFVAGMAAVAMLFVAIGDRMVPSANPPRQFLAVLSANAGMPAFVATVNLDSQTLVVRRVAGDPAPPDRSYELWAIPSGSAPQSLGVIQQARYTANLNVPPANLTLAVTLEPQGGSKTGAPTGPIVFSGQLIAGN